MLSWIKARFRPEDVDLPRPVIEPRLVRLVEVLREVVDKNAIALANFSFRLDATSRTVKASSEAIRTLSDDASGVSRASRLAAEAAQAMSEAALRNRGKSEDGMAQLS